MKLSRKVFHALGEKSGIRNVFFVPFIFFCLQLPLKLSLLLQEALVVAEILRSQLSISACPPSLYWAKGETWVASGYALCAV